jgi:hypothetical protein
MGLQRLSGVAMLAVLFSGVSLCGAGVTNLNDLAELNIAEGERVVFSNIVDEVVISGEVAKVTANFVDTSVLAAGRHRLVYTAMTFDGMTAVKETFLNVGGSGPLSDVPVISGVSNHVFSESRRFDMLRTVEARAAAGEPLVCRVNVPWVEQLAPGVHSIYYTAVDAAGKSAVTNCLVTVLPLAEKFRRAEWSLLGRALYIKYFESERLQPYFQSSVDIVKVFTYGSPQTEPGISAHVSFRDVEFDMLSFGAHPMKVEALAARMTALLEELRHHRRIWYDQPYITFAVDIRGFQAGTDNKKERGLYSVRIPNAVFRRDDFGAVLLGAFKSMPKAEFRSRSDNKGKVCHNLYTDPQSGIRILFEQDLIEGFAWDYKSRWKRGEVTLEEFFDADMFGSELSKVMQRFRAGGFGAFTDPILPFIKQQRPTP